MGGEIGKEGRRDGGRVDEVGDRELMRLGNEHVHVDARLK